MLKKVISSVLAVCLCLMCLCGCETYDNFINAFFPEENPEVTEEPADTVKIGVFEPLTGADAEGAAEEISGIELAHELYPTVLGKDVELVYADNESSDAAAVDAAKELVGQGVSVVLGSYRNVLSLAGADVFCESRTPAIAVTCTNPLITQSNNYYSRACFIDADQGQTAAIYGVTKLDKDWFTVMYQEGDDYAASLAEQFCDEIAARLGNTYSVATVTFPGGTEDFSLYLQKLSVMRTGPIFFPSDAALGEEIIHQASELGFDFSWIGTSKWLDITDCAAQLQRGTEHLEGVAFVADYSADTSLGEMTEIFRDAYAKKYGSDAVPGKNAALGFDAYLLALEGITQAGTADAGTLIANKLCHIKGFAAATGTITMGPKGDPTKDVVIDIVKDGAVCAGYTVTR